MKMVLIVFNISIEDDVRAILDRCGAACFTQWPRLIGTGKTTGSRFDDNIWPGANGALFAVVGDDDAKKLMAEIDAMRHGAAKREGIKAFLLNVEAATGEL